MRGRVHAPLQLLGSADVVRLCVLGEVWTGRRERRWGWEACVRSRRAPASPPSRRNARRPRPHTAPHAERCKRCRAATLKNQASQNSSSAPLRAARARAAAAAHSPRCSRARRPAAPGAGRDLGVWREREDRSNDQSEDVCMQGGAACVWRGRRKQKRRARAKAICSAPRRVRPLPLAHAHESPTSHEASRSAASAPSRRAKPQCGAQGGRQRLPNTHTATHTRSHTPLSLLARRNSQQDERTHPSTP